MPSIQLDADKPSSGYCLLRTTETTGWIKAPNCSARLREDRSLSIESVGPNDRTPRPQPKCLFVLNESGKRLGCNTPVGARAPLPVPALKTEPSLELARFYAPFRGVAPGRNGALYGLTPDGNLDEANRMGQDVQSCWPLLPTMPVFRCVKEGGFDVVVRIGADGGVHEELRRKRTQTPDEVVSGEQDPLGVFHVTVDGGIAVGGDCEGKLGNVACVRNTSGVWHDVSFSRELVAALSRTAPATRLVPTPEGQLYVGTGTTEGLLGGPVHVSIFRADGGPAVPIEKIPAWIVGSLAGLGNAGALLARSHIRTAGPSLAWSTSRIVRIWPLEREHPAFRTKESCRVDIALDGTFETACVQGRMFAVGRVGLWEKRRGELHETLDAGETWTPVPLPEGLETDDTVCSPLGCRIGPYWRMGWGGSQ